MDRWIDGWMDKSREIEGERDYERKRRASNQYARKVNIQPIYKHGEL